MQVLPDVISQIVKGGIPRIYSSLVCARKIMF